LAAEYQGTVEPCSVQWSEKSDIYYETFLVRTYSEMRPTPNGFQATVQSNDASTEIGHAIAVILPIMEPKSKYLRHTDTTASETFLVVISD